MKKTTGYKGMLRDRCPKTVNYALKWQKAKERWIDHAYNNFIKFYVKKEDRKNATRIILGISKFYRNFDFNKSIDWDNITEEETKYWKTVSSWVNWFRKYYAPIKSAYEISHEAGKNDFDIKVSIISRYLSALQPKNTDEESTKQEKYKYIDNLVDFLFKCFEERI